jgi:hypothetical protein
MKASLVVIVLIVLSSNSVTAQPTLFNYFESENVERYVFGDTVFVRQGTGTSFKVLDTLFAGNDITIISIDTTQHLLKGFTAPWVKIKYKKDTVSKEGFIWAGLLSYTALRRGDVKFVFGVDRCISKTVTSNNEKYPEYSFVIKLKAMKFGSVLHQQKFTINGSESMAYTEGKVSGGNGLDGVQYLINLLFSGEACGIPAYTYTYAWDGKQLNELPLRTHISDAGVFYHEETFVFPADKGGQKGMLIKKITIGEATDKTDKNGENIMKETSSTMLYKWDGKKAVFIKKS